MNLCLSKNCSNLNSYSHEWNQNKSVLGFFFCQINPGECNQLLKWDWALQS